MDYQSVTPILVVEQIEPCLFFWVGRLGFQKVSEVYEGDKLGFVILTKDNVQVMYQTYSSLQKDMPSAHKALSNPKAQAMIYVKISNMDWIAKHLDGVEVVVPKRQTMYGATEICVREPAGNLVTFATFKDTQVGQSHY